MGEHPEAPPFGSLYAPLPFVLYQPANASPERILLLVCGVFKDFVSLNLMHRGYGPLSGPQISASKLAFILNDGGCDFAQFDYFPCIQQLYEDKAWYRRGWKDKSEKIDYIESSMVYTLRKRSVVRLDEGNSSPVQSTGFLARLVDFRWQTPEYRLVVMQVANKGLVQQRFRRDELLDLRQIGIFVPRPGRCHPELNDNETPASICATGVEDDP
ncbi:hypothetical protein AJ80_09885 [Polytolypa hystricis UAMH7299]|uniref:Uncharacterized protein n=1 Tax=Polytolypa hystricis (strain UAMH7299) TaxID=1447883 RepID=A0A2B7WH76_POLH7|nr:hypothetical protein AJ80_09885 [Polytolypa hystricis UAMH7299]